MQFIGVVKCVIHRKVGFGCQDDVCKVRGLIIISDIRLIILGAFYLF